MRSMRWVFIILTLVFTLSCGLPWGTDTLDEEQLEGTPPGETSLEETPFAETPPGETLQPPAESTPATDQPPPSCPENRGKVLFSSNLYAYPEAGANFDIYIAGKDGANITRLTDFELWEGYPAWSPDFCRIAYSASIHGESQTEIFVMNADGSEALRLTTVPADDREPTWSPDGSQIVFTHQDGEVRDLYIMQSDGSGLRALADHPEEDEKPEWSPVNDEIVFQSQRDGNFNIFIIRSDGTGLTRITDDALQDTHPSWSPDGSQIAFMSNRTGHQEIYIINRDGSGLHAVTNQGNGVPSPIIELSWSFDGSSIAFGCFANHESSDENTVIGTSICAVNIDGSDLRVLAERGSHDCRQPDW